MDTVTDVDFGEHDDLAAGLSGGLVHELGALLQSRHPSWSYGTHDDVVQRKEHSAALLQALSRAMATALTAWMRHP